MSDNTTEGQQDLFDDSAADAGSDTSAVTKADDAGAGDDADKGAKTDDSATEGDATDQTGAKKAAGTPPADEEDQEAVTDEKTGKKLIPEHRFKAALKKVTDELEATKGKLTEYEKPEPIPVPDKDVDPEGHALHTRMEASQAVMRDLVPDYQEKIDHFAKMAESNPLLNQAVAGHAIPAKLAYDIAAKDLEIKEALNIKGSDDWKKFQEWQKTQKEQPKLDEQAKLGEKVKNGLGRTVPNLNRSTNASPNRNVRKISAAGGDDPLWDDYKR
jgi:hypothetical protein